jgi:hypothetical protein
MSLDRNVVYALGNTERAAASACRPFRATPNLLENT